MTKSSAPDRAKLNASLKEMVSRILVTGHHQKDARQVILQLQLHGSSMC
jgi:tRNA(Ile)-lysidine synthase TilS/MesJ